MAAPVEAAARTVRLAAGLDDLLAGAGPAAPLRSGDSKSGTRMERVLVDGVPHVVKYLDAADSWLMRATGDPGTRQLHVFTSGLLDRLPDRIDHAVVAAAPFPATAGRTGTALLMRDVGDALVPEGSDPVTPDVEAVLVDAMAALHAAHTGFAGDDRLMSLATHYLFLGEAMAALEAELGGGEAVPAMVVPGWRRLGDLEPRAAAAVRRLLDDPDPLVAALESTPQTLVHGDWKLGNLGVHPDGRAVLLDWDRVSRGPAALDLAWYLAVNCDRLARGKEGVVDLYRERLEAHGVATDGWFERQLALALAGAFLQLGWSKLGGEAGEVAWWERAVLAALPLLEG